MSSSQWIHSYLVANLLLVCALLALLIFDRLQLVMAWKSQLRLHYAAIGAVFLLAFGLPLLPLSPLSPRPNLENPIFKAVVSQTLPRMIHPFAAVASAPQFELRRVPPKLSLIFLAVNSGVALLWFAKLIRELRLLSKLRTQSFRVRSLCGVQIFVSEEVDVPLCFWWPGSLNLVLPYELLGSPEFKIVILHELQHHRQGDTKSVYGLSILKMVFGINPAVYFWNRWISALQEFACDSALVGHKKVEPLAYATCLVQIAENWVGRRSLSAGAAARTFLTDRNTIQGRIQEMLKERQIKTSRGAVALAALMLGGFLSATAFAARGESGDRHVNLADAQELLAHASPTGGFPVVVNERVVKWLNIYVGSPEGRERMSAALERMPTFKSVIERRLKEYGLPSELLAIPLIESGYRNLPASANPVRAAGLWQFMAGTAVNFGLQVDTAVDERLDVEKETDAALRLLYSDKLRFDDWELSILAYNSGEGFVQKEISKLGSRDAWTLIANGDGSAETNDYLPRLMAAILILRNPALVH